VPLTICGLGPFPPDSATLEALDAIRRADAVFQGELDKKTTAWLRSFCGRLRPFSGPGPALRLLRSGREVVYAARSYPMTLGPLAKSLLDRARAEGIPVTVLGALTPFSSFLSHGRQVLPYALGSCRVVETSDPKQLRALAPDDELPLLACGAEAERPEELGRWLLSRFPADRDCLLIPLGSSAGGSEGERSKLGRLAGWTDAMWRSHIVFVHGGKGRS
jgi:hypothetical protein